MSKPLTIAELRQLEERVQVSTVLTSYAKAHIQRVIAEVHRLRQGLWDCVIISGADTDGDTTPDSLVYPDIVDYAKREVQQLRDDYDEAIRECSC